MCIQNYIIQIRLLTFILVVQICSTTTLVSTSSSQIDLIEEETKFDKINSSPNTDQIESSSTPLPEVSKQTMDIITIIWYLSTFLALAAFFFLMACSDRRCGRNRRSANNLNELDDDQQCPPTPSPSYSQFAPPSYESIVKENSHIYVVPIDLKISAEKTASNIEFSSTTDCKIDTINEMQKNLV